MKTPLITVIFISLYCLLSCSKDETYVPIKYFEGSYEWQVTESASINGSSTEMLYQIYPNDVGHNYGLKIKKSGRCYFYTDGKLTKEGKITEAKHYTDNYYTGEPYRFEINWEESTDMVFEGANNSKFFCRTFPVHEDDSRNQFVKIGN